MESAILFHVVIVSKVSLGEVADPRPDSQVTQRDGDDGPPG